MAQGGGTDGGRHRPGVHRGRARHRRQSPPGDASSAPARGVRLALDWGQARIGVAACDPAGALAYPVETVPAGPDASGADRRRWSAEYEPIEVVVGLPRSLSGGEGPAAATGPRTQLAALVAAVGRCRSVWWTSG